MTTPELPDYVIARLRRPAFSQHVVSGSTPVLSFGDATTATVATLGLNPSRQEFLDTSGRELEGRDRRFETLKSLDVPDLDSAELPTLHRVVDACNDYFHRNPYRRWFDQLEPVLKSVGASYYDGSACHLDLVQWATDPVWGKIPDPAERDRLVTQDATFLRHQLTTRPFKLLLINGSGVVRQFESMMRIALKPAGNVKGSSTESRFSVGDLPNGTRVIAWSVNVQSSFGVCKTLRAALAMRTRELGLGSASN